MKIDITKQWILVKAFSYVGGRLILYFPLMLMFLKIMSLIEENKLLLNDINITFLALGGFVPLYFSFANIPAKKELLRMKISRMLFDAITDLFMIFLIISTCIRSVPIILKEIPLNYFYMDTDLHFDSVFVTATIITTVVMIHPVINAVYFVLDSIYDLLPSRVNK